MKTQLKIALFLIATNIMMLLLFGGSIYYFLYNYSYADFYKRLETRATIAAKYNFDADKVTAESFKTIREEHLERLTEEKEYLYQIEQNTDLKEVAKKSLLPLHFIRDIIANAKSTLQINDTFYTGIRYNNNEKLYIVVVSAKNYYASHHLLFMRNIIFVAIVLIILITTYLSLFFQNIFLTP
jgi:hypothetical protein